MSGDSCYDPATGRPRRLSGQCSTCIGKPGNLMQLQPGRVKQMVSEAARQGSQGIICHQTLSYGGHEGFGPPALCAWFYERYGHLTNFIRCIERIGGFTVVDPPAEENSHD